MLIRSQPAGLAVSTQLGPPRARAEGISCPSGQQHQQRCEQQVPDEWCKHWGNFFQDSLRPTERPARNALASRAVCSLPPQ